MEFYDEKDMEYWRKQADLGKAVILEIPISMLLDLDIRSLSEKQGEKTSMDGLDAWLSRNRDDLEKALEYEKKEKKAVEMLEESLYDGSNSEKKKDESDHSKQTELSDAAAKVSRIMATETFSEDQIAVIAEAMLENLDSIVMCFGNPGYKGLSMDEIIHHLAIFISRLWQIHVFGEGNTRTTAVFFIKYLRSLGFDVTNDIFAENAWNFRNSLVRANYNDLKNGIHETTEYLELFLRNMLLNEDHPLHNRTLHISSTFKEMEKPDIGETKPDIEKLKADIEELFQPKTTSHILMLREAFPGQSIFGRSDVMSVIEIKPSRASDLLKDMAEHGIIEPVTGHGKGKYRFKKQRD